MTNQLTRKYAVTLLQAHDLPCFETIKGIYTVNETCHNGQTNKELILVVSTGLSEDQGMTKRELLNFLGY